MAREFSWRLLFFNGAGLEVGVVKIVKTRPAFLGKCSFFIPKPNVERRVKIIGRNFHFAIEKSPWSMGKNHLSEPGAGFSEPGKHAGFSQTVVGAPLSSASAGFLKAASPSARMKLLTCYRI